MADNNKALHITGHIHITPDGRVNWALTDGDLTFANWSYNWDLSKLSMHMAHEIIKESHKTGKRPPLGVGND